MVLISLCIWSKTFIQLVFHHKLVAIHYFGFLPILYVPMKTRVNDCPSNLIHWHMYIFRRKSVHKSWANYCDLKCEFEWNISKWFCFDSLDWNYRTHLNGSLLHFFYPHICISFRMEWNKKRKRREIRLFLSLLFKLNWWIFSLFSSDSWLLPFYCQMTEINST